MARKTRKQIFKELLATESRNFRWFFSGVHPLLTGATANLPAALAYSFHLIETGHHRILYGSLCRIHDANSLIAKNAVNAQHMTREKFGQLFKNVVGIEIPPATLEKRESAEAVRDRIVHGKSATEAEIWAAVKLLANYAVELNSAVKNKAHFEAFGDMRGVVGRRGAVPLSNSTTRWLIKGMGFDLS